MPFTDLHSHILPGFDDGAEDQSEFLKMARVAVQGGTSLIVATPHYDLESPGIELQEIPRAVDNYLRLLRSHDIPLMLVPGVEVRLNAGLFRLAREDGAMDELSLAGGGKFILVDLPLFNLPVATDDIIFQVQLRGLTPILAHPERNRYLVKHPAKIRGMVERGVEIQVNSGSLEGIYGRVARRMALALLKESLARLIASDAHQAMGRTPDLSGAASIVRHQLGTEAVRIMLEVNPGRALAGESLVKAVDDTSRASRPSGRLRRRKSP